MLETKTKIVRTFDPEAGHHVQEVPVGSTEGIAVPMPPPEPALPVKVTAADVSLSVAQEVFTAAGFVAVPIEAIEKLPKTHAEAIMRATRTAPAAIDDAALVEQVNSCTTMDELDAVMDGCTSPVVIAAAEEKAAELTAGKEGE